MKAFFGKALAWILGHKAIAITIAAVLVVGATSAIVLPIALHEHSFATEWSSDADSHWHSAICKHEGEKSDLAAHTYDNACDTKCNVCNAARTVGAHVYDNACDTTCNACNATRTVEPHVYDNACDTACNVCGATRTITHDHADTLTAGDTTHWYACSVCGDKKDEAAHVFDQTVAHSDYLKAEATATAKAQYYKSCVCGKASATEYFETDKTAATLTNIQDLSKTYDKVALQNPTYETNSDGAVTIEWYKGNTKLDAKPVSAGTYKVKVIIAESATFAGTSAEKEFTIAKKKLSNLSFEFVYRGEANFDTDYLTEAQGILAADVADGIFIFVQFDSKNVGATVTDIEIDFGEEADSYENYEIDMATFTASIVKRAVWAENAAFPYDGYDIFCGDEYPVFTLQNVVSGETIDLGDVSWIFDSKNVGATLTDVELSEEYNPNYTIDFSKCSASIVKRSIWVENVEFAYGGYDNFYGDGATAAVTFENLANGDTLDAGDVWFKMTGIDAGSTLAEIHFDGAGNNITDNYEFDFSKCTARIVPKVIDNLTYAFEYNGMEYHQAIISKNEHSGIVGDDQISLEVCFVTPNVGAALDTSEETGFEPGFVDENYVLGESYTFSVVPRTLDYLEITKVYDGEGVLAYPLGTEHGVLAGDTVLFYCDEAPDYDVGTYKLIPDDDPTTIDDSGADDRASLAGEDKANYKFAERIEGKYKLCATITVTPKPLSLLDIKFTYDGGSIPSRFDLTAADGVIAGDDVYLYGDGWQSYDVAGDVYTLTDDMEDGDADEGVALRGAAAGNYKFSYDSDGRVGTVEVLHRVVKLPAVIEKVYDGTNMVTYTFTEADGLAEWDNCTVTFPCTGWIDVALYRGLRYSVVKEQITLSNANYRLDLDASDTNLNITKKTVTPPAALTAEYNGTNELVATFTVDGVAVTMPITAVKGSDPVITVGTHTGVSITCGTAKNFEFAVSEDATFELTVGKKKLTGLDIQVSADAYYNAQFTLGKFLTLLEKDGVVAGEAVGLKPGAKHSEKLPVGTVLYLYAGLGAAPGDEYALYSDLVGANAGNYELVSYYNEDSYLIYGTITIIEGCSAQYDGSCACGESHLTKELTVSSSASVTETLDGTWEGGIYKVTVSDIGIYRFAPSANFATYTLYDAAGNKLTERGDGYRITTAGTYYWHVGMNSAFVAGTDALEIEWVNGTGTKADDPYLLTFDANGLVAEDPYWGRDPQTFYSVALTPGDYYVAQGLKVFVETSAGATMFGGVAQDHFTITSAGNYKIVVRKATGDNNAISVHCTKFSLVNATIMDGAAETMTENADGRFLSEEKMAYAGTVRVYKYDPTWDINDMNYSLTLMKGNSSEGAMDGVKSFTVYDCNFIEWEVEWDNETLNFYEPITDGPLYIVITFEENGQYLLMGYQ